MRAVFAIVAALCLACPALAQTTVSFPTEDGGVVFADLYGSSDRALVLAHGGRFNKESWAPQARALQGAGFEALAIDFRGYGKSHGPGDKDPMYAPLELDVLARTRRARRACRSSAAAWEAQPREMHRSIRGRERLTAS